MIITLVRHGEAEHNIDQAKAYTFDTKLTPFGCLPSSLLSGCYDVVFTSTLNRTKMIFEHSQIQSHRIVCDSRVREYRTCTCDFVNGEFVEYESEDNLVHRCKDFYECLKSYKKKDLCHYSWWVHKIFLLKLLVYNLVSSRLIVRQLSLK